MTYAEIRKLELAEADALFKAVTAQRAEDASRLFLKHGQTRGGWTPEYGAWVHMRQRCNNPKNTSFRYYGGRGIRVCDRWDSFENFLADVGVRPSTDHSLDRYPNQKGNYEPGNVRWATRADQNRNRSNTRFYEFQGRRLTLGQWANETGVSKGTLWFRLRVGWSIERTLTTEVAS